jgi:two-component system sensor histidine kinase CreC
MVKIRTRLFIAILALVALALYALVYWIVDDLRPRYLATMEESMVDTVTVLASLLEHQLLNGEIRTDDLRQAFDSAQRKQFAATIYEVTKTTINMRAYVTDRKGIVVFDSDNGKDEGQDYSRWNDVRLTLSGRYGVRATRSDADDPMTSVIHVAAPIRYDDQIIGVVTISKPTYSVARFLATARRDIVVAVGIAVMGAIVLGMAVSMWISRPIEKLTHYAKAVRDGRRVPAPRLGKDEVGVLGAAFEEMRVALEGKRYVEEYVQTLTHQMKGPLSAIRGAAELLDEDMPSEQRSQFLQNIRSESARIQDLIERMLQLSALEGRKELRDVEEVDMSELVTDVLAEMQPMLAAKQLEIKFQPGESVVVKGERFLLRQAFANLLQNAIDFGPEKDAICISVETRDGKAVISISDNGPGIPDYALDKVFTRFYSLCRPDTGKKSSGLGLTFAKEVADLHGGQIRIANRAEGGAKVTLSLPI